MTCAHSHSLSAERAALITTSNAHPAASRRLQFARNYPAPVHGTLGMPDSPPLLVAHLPSMLELPVFTARRLGDCPLSCPGDAERLCGEEPVSVDRRA